MARFYMILLREFRRDCDCANQLPRPSCYHAPNTLADTWKVWRARNGSGDATIYKTPPVRQSITAATNRGSSCTVPAQRTIADGYTPPVYTKLLPHPHRVVYFETDDLLDYTADHELAYQQKEAKMERAALAAAEAQQVAANPPPPLVAALTPKKRVRKKSVVVTGGVT